MTAARDWRRGQVVRQRPAKPSPPVQIWVAPLKELSQSGSSFFCLVAKSLSGLVSHNALIKLAKKSLKRDLADLRLSDGRIALFAHLTQRVLCLDLLVGLIAALCALADGDGVETRDGGIKRIVERIGPALGQVGGA